MSELFPAKTIALVYTDCTDDSRGYQFSHWYNKLYIPSLMENPGIEGIYRYRNMAAELREGQARYLTLFRLHSDDPWHLMQEIIAENHGKGGHQTRMPDYVRVHRVTVWDFITYRRTISPLERPETHLSDGMPEAMFVVPTICTDPSREDEFRDWYLHTHFHDLLETPGIVQAHRYKSLNPTPKENESRYLAIYEIDSENPADVVRQVLREDRDIRIPQGRMINCIAAPDGLDTYQHIDM